MCKHRKKVKSSQAYISINSCTELRKTKFLLWVLFSQSKCSSEPENFLKGIHPLNPLLKGSDPPALLTLTTLPFPLIMFPTGSYDKMWNGNKTDIIKWRVTNLYSGESNMLMVSLSNNKGGTFYKMYLNFIIIFFLEQNISTCHGFNMLIVDQSFILTLS